MEKPKIRPIEAIPTVHEGRTLLVLRDPEGFSDRTLVVSEQAAFLLAFMDGEHTYVDIQAEFLRRYGDMLFTADLEKLLSQLDQSFLLDNDHFRDERRRVTEEYRAAAARPVTRLHPPDADAETWRAWVDGFLLAAGGAEPPGEGAPVRAIVAPHIDLRLGGATYGAAWRVVPRDDPPDLVVLVGTCHHYLPSLIAGTVKDFDTPLGRVKTDRAFMEELGRRSGGFLFDDEIAHRMEHTIEFQTLFVRHFAGKGETKIAPLLCAYSPDDLSGDAGPESPGRVEAFARSLADLIDEHPGRVLLVASADLSHIGPRYGDERAPSPADLDRLEERDRSLLATVLSVDPGGFAERLAQTDDRTRVCGFAPIHLVLSALRSGKGALLRYDQGVMGEEGSVVSFAALAFT